MAFGFVIERFGLFLQITGREESKIFHRQLSFFVGESLILLASLLAIYSIVQHKRILRNINAEDVPAGYNLFLGMIANAVIGSLGILLGTYLFWGF
jgi:putative membrane protein